VEVRLAVHGLEDLDSALESVDLKEREGVAEAEHLSLSSLHYYRCLYQVLVQLAAVLQMLACADYLVVGDAQLQEVQSQHFEDRPGWVVDRPC
jgi:hypothetical protein